jgi:hypothetical protein
MYKYLKNQDLSGFLKEMYFLVLNTGKDTEFMIINLDIYRKENEKTSALL